MRLDGNETARGASELEPSHQFPLQNDSKPLVDVLSARESALTKRAGNGHVELVFTLNPSPYIIHHPLIPFNFMARAADMDARRELIRLAEPWTLLLER